MVTTPENDGPGPGSSSNGEGEGVGIVEEDGMKSNDDGNARNNNDTTTTTIDETATIIIPSSSYISSASEYDQDNEEDLVVEGRGGGGETAAATATGSAAVSDAMQDDGLSLGVSSVEFATNDQQTSSGPPPPPQTPVVNRGSGGGSGTTPMKETINSSSPSPPSAGSGSGSASNKSKTTNNNKSATKNPPPSQPNLLQPAAGSNRASTNSPLLLPPRTDATSTAVTAGGDESSSEFTTTSTNTPMKLPPSSASASVSASASATTPTNNNNNGSGIGGSGSGSGHNFFLRHLQHQQHNPYDSDGSNASLIFSAPSPQHQHQQQQPRRGSGSGSVHSSASAAKPPTATSGSSSSTASRGGRGMPLQRREPPLSSSSTTTTTTSLSAVDDAGGSATATGGLSSSSSSLPGVVAGQRERLSSTDSFQSTGSIRYVMSQSPSDHAKGSRGGTTTGGPGNSATGTGTAGKSSGGSGSGGSTSKISEPSPPRVLPYHERRKLLQQKQQQQPQTQPPLPQPHVQPYPMDVSQQEQIHLQQQQQQQEQQSSTMPNMEQQQQQIQIQQAAAAAQAQAAYFAQLNAFAQAQAQPQHAAQAPQSQPEQRQNQQQGPSSPQPTPTMFPPFVDPQMMAAYYHQLAYGGAMPPPQYSPAVPGMMPPPYGYQASLPNNSQPQDQQNQQQMNPMMMGQVPFHMMSPDHQRQMYEYQQQQQQQFLQFAAYQQQQMYQQMNSSNTMQVDQMGVPGQNHASVPFYSYPPKTHDVGTDQSRGQPPPGPQPRPHRHKRSDSSGVPLLYNSNMPLEQLQQTDGAKSQPNQDIGFRHPSTTEQSSESTPTITNVKTLNTNPSLVQASSTRPDSFSSAGSNSSVPPPPPPPPPPFPTTTRPPVGHARSHSGISHSQSDSFGSISSLGSSDRHHRTGSFSRDLQVGSTEAVDKDGQGQSLTAKQPDRQDRGKVTIATNQTPPQPSDRKSEGSTATTSTNVNLDSVTTPEAIRETVTHTRQNSFLNMLRLNWSPQSQAKERKQPDVNDFHRRNQEFLQSHQKRTQAVTIVPPFPAPSESPHHRRVGSQDHPPPSRGTHRRLSSIPQHPDGWNDGEDSNSVDSPSDGTDKKPKASSSSSRLKRSPPPPPPANTGPYSIDQTPSYDTNETASTPDSRLRYSDDEEEDNRARNYLGYGGTPLDADYSDDDDVDEKTSLLPAAGISSNEQDGKYRGLQSDRPKADYGLMTSVARPYDGSYIPSPSPRSEWSSDSSRPLSPSDATMSTNRWDNRTAKMMFEAAQKNKKSRKKKYRRRSAHQATVQKGIDDEEEEESDEEDSDMDYRAWTMKRANMLEKERSKMIEQWKQEARAEAEIFRREAEAKEPHRRCWASIARVFADVGDKSFRCLTRLEIFIANLPLTIGAVAMAVVTLGVVWFKFAEEFLSTCEPVHFHSSQCNYPEFPGCFYCDQTVLGYKIALSFHYGCKLIAGFLAMLAVAKVLLATRVVMDEMSSPTTSSPAGLLCMTTCVVFAGRGVVGQVLVSAAACGHLCLVMWFIYMALAYRIMPEPSWFPNTIGIGLSAVKTWLYYPTAGHLLMAISLLLNFFFFPISLIRVAANKKISATVGWMQMGAPAISLYALTIMAQPSFEEEHPDVTNFQKVHRMVYLPCMHAMMALTIIGMGASLHSLSVRWADFSKRKFSPAHAAFAFPTLSHANAIQAYRGAVMSFAGIPSRTWPFFILDAYWLVVLIGGTVATFWICGKFLYHLPEWTAPDLMDEEEPPAPYDTLLSQKDMVTVGDHLTQPFVSAAIIQANETGALIMARNRRDGTIRYVRTRRVGALGFEPTMNWSEMQEEAEVLLEWVGKHPPRRRHRTLSVPGIDFSYGASAQPFGTGNVGVYGTMSSDQQAHNRNMTLGANDTRYLF